VVGRSRYGTQGWSTRYNFTLQDLRQSSHIVFSYLERSSGGTPWDDIGHMVGRIMYGGHITDVWDQRVLNTYLRKFLNDSLYEELELAPGFAMPPAPGSHDSYMERVHNSFPAEQPLTFGLSANAEKISMTKQADELFGSLLVAMKLPEDSEDSQTGAVGSTVHTVLDELQEKCPPVAEVHELWQRAAGATEADDPFVNVLVQELRLLERLVMEIHRSLQSLSQALTGEATMTEATEALQISLDGNRVPATWHAVACPSCKPLAEWVVDLGKRHTQLEEWSNALALPVALWLHGLFNAQSFLAAVMQASARKLGIAIDEMVIVTDVTRKHREDVETAPREGAYVLGLYLEGASYDSQNGMLHHQSAGRLAAQLHPELPVVHIRAILRAPGGANSNIYHCPVYRTVQRGKTFVFTATLKVPIAEDMEWTIAGVAILLERL